MSSGSRGSSGVKALHAKDLARGHGRAPLPHALGRRYPNATREWRWQFVFLSGLRAADRKTGEVCCFHAAGGSLQKAVEAAGVDNRLRVHEGAACGLNWTALRD